MTDVHLEAARRRRDEILDREDMLDDDGVRELLGAAPRELRETRQLLGLWDGVRIRYLYPAFQVDGPACAIRRGVRELLALLPPDRGGWRAGFWVFQPHARLGGHTPADALASNASAVLEAARSSFHPGDTNW
jgi:hypothetical protein